jgi:predicted dienelactone hydrolase
MRLAAATLAAVVCWVNGAAAKQLPVGVTTLTFTKTSVTTNQPRPLVTTIWYPAVKRTGTAETYGLRDAKAKRGRFPLIVFSHGTCGRPTEASYLTMALVREGAIVAAPAHPGNTTDDGPSCLGGDVFIDSAVNREPDVAFVIDSMLAQAGAKTSRFARRIDDDAIGVTGLSFGGFTTLLTAILDPRVDVALAMVPGGTNALGTRTIAVPTMVIGAEHDMVVTFPESERAYAKLTGPRFLVELLAANHLSVVDSCSNGLGNLNLCVPTDISQDEAHRLVLDYAVPFFRRYLLSKKRAVLRAADKVLSTQIDGVVLTTEP